jgi:hypothetical protein
MKLTQFQKEILVQRLVARGKESVFEELDKLDLQPGDRVNIEWQIKYVADIKDTPAGHITFTVDGEEIFEANVDQTGMSERELSRIHIRDLDE